MHDIAILNGTIVDGSGSAPSLGYVLISDGVIVSTGVESTLRNLDVHASITIDAKNKIVCPGFIDIHTHSDLTLIADGRGESKLRQGVTTEVVGNCSFSAFPI